MLPISNHPEVTIRTACFVMLTLVVLSLSGPACNQEFQLLPSVSLDDPVIFLDSVKLTASYNLEETRIRDVESFGFFWATDPDLQSASTLIAANIGDGKFDTVLAGLDLDRDYYVQAFIAIGGEGFILSTIDRIRTGDIAISTSWSATGQRFFDITSETVLEIIQLNGSASGLRTDKRVQSYGHIWISRDSRESLRSAFGSLEQFNVDLNGVDKIENTDLPAGDAQFSFIDELDLDPLQFHLVRPFAVYNDMTRYGDTVEVFIGNVWKRLRGINEISHAVSFVIEDTAYVTTGMRTADIESPSYSHDLIAYDPVSNEYEAKKPFPGAGRVDAVAFVLGGEGYVGSGRQINKSLSMPLKDFWVYDPGRDKWRDTFSLPIAVYDAISFVINGKAYVGTGDTGIGQTDRIFRLGATGWEEMPALGTSISNAVATVIDDYAYILTGKGVQREFWRGDGSSYTQIDIPASGSPGAVRQSAVSFALGRCLYVGAGSNDPAGFIPTFSDFYVYDLDRPERFWIEVDVLSNGVRAHGTAFTINKKGYYWGGLLVRPDGTIDIAAAVWAYTPAPN